MGKPQHAMAMKAMVESTVETGSTKKAVYVLDRVMNEALSMAMTYGPGGAEYDDDLYRKYLRLTAETAGRLAPEELTFGFDVARGLFEEAADGSKGLARGFSACWPTTMTVRRSKS
jgi:hypothetical protein